MEQWLQKIFSFLTLVRVYEWNYFPINTTGQKKFEKYNSIILKNSGTQSCLINGIDTMLPGDRLTLDGYPGEICSKTFEFSFTNDRLPGANMVVIIKSYKD